MLIYKKNNKLNINFDNEVSEQPDLQISKEDGKTSVKIDGQESGGGSVTSVNGKTGAVMLTAADLDDSFKDALLDCFANVAWATEDGQQYYDALESALYPPADLVSISAVFNQGQTVIYDTDSLDVLKPMLTVTANYDNGTRRTVTDYTLSGTLEVETSTITVSYGGKTTTFDVTVSAPAFLYELSERDFSRGLGIDIDYNSTPPYTYVVPKRISYVDFDLLFDGGKTYEIIATSTKDTANMGLQFFNAALLDDVANHNNIGYANTIDLGWQNLSVTYAVPATHNNSPIKGCRITFRESSADPNISSDFKITKLTIREVAA